MTSGDIEKIVDFIVACVYTFNLGVLSGITLMGWMVMR